SIVVPSFRRGLPAPAHARPTSGSITGPVSTSDSQSESNPSSSSPVMSSASASGEAIAPPVPTPMRIFMVPTSGQPGPRADLAELARDLAPGLAGILADVDFAEQGIRDDPARLGRMH